jgi:hypothetical protein
MTLRINNKESMAREGRIEEGNDFHFAPVNAYKYSNGERNELASCTSKSDSE